MKKCLNSIFLKMFLICCITTTYAQEDPISPDIATLYFKNILNYKTDSLSFSDFAGKLIILDFWSQYCSSCLKAFPKIDSLQKEFKANVQFILVNKESIGKTRHFMAIKKYLHWPDIPMITEDTILHSKFPAEGYPYHVWIDKNQKVINLTGGYNTTKENIGAYLDGKRSHLHPRGKKPALSGSLLDYINEEIGHDIEYASYISKCKDRLDVGSSEGSTYGTNNIRIASNCVSIAELFRKAYREYDSIDINYKYSIQLEVENKENYVVPEDPNLFDSWRMNSSYSYELIIPQERKKERYKIMQDDLKRYFNIEATIEKRKIKGYAIVKRGRSKKIKSVGSNTHNGLSAIGGNTDSICIIRNIPFPEVYKTISRWFQLEYPIVDKTEIKHPVDIDLSCLSLYPLDIPLFKANLKKHNLDLVERYLKRDILVLKEKKHGK